jgi:putative membrane protein
MVPSISIGSTLTIHMVLHVLLMNVAAPLVALLALRMMIKSFCLRGHWLALATSVQIALLWGWHAPSIMEKVLSETSLHVFMQMSLFAAASVFWFLVFSQRGADLWRAILALLVTSKLYCLLGVLLMFAPVSLYSGVDLHHSHGLGTLGDQQMAGLLMLLACPPTYVLLGIILAAQWVRALAKQDYIGWVPATKSSS